MSEIMTYTLEATKRIPIADVSTSERFYEPTLKQIDEMVASLKAVGQLTAIMVHPVTRNSWRIVAGGTRLRAAFKLGWTHIRADIISGSSIDYRIIELAENAERRNLTAAQRQKAKSELKKLIREKLETVKAAKGGRGKRGGVSEAARQVGISNRTARRARDDDAKPRQNEASAQVSELYTNGQGGELIIHASPATTPAPAQPPASVALEQMPAKISVNITGGERARIARYNESRCGNGSLSDCMRKLIRQALNAEGF